ncbi:MAG: DNA replication/repair protein RecF [Bacteroidaceae bacterium]|nr:DNA replication/repair protein RecF [Bacteroidaceae bacterium]
MILRKLSIINYKNISQADLVFSPKINCLIGDNGEGKTNVLDAIHFLSLCKSITASVDSQCIRHGEEFAVLQGVFEHEDGRADEEIYLGLRRGQKKQLKRNKKAYKRLAEHIGIIPVVLVSPMDSVLISGGSEERRRFMDVVISQYDHNYLNALIHYNHALQQRNAMLKQEEPEVDYDLLSLWEEEMARNGLVIYEAREAYVKELIPVFQRIYDSLSLGREQVGLSYTSHAQRGDLLDIIQRDRAKDFVMGYSLHGIHKDDMEMTLSGYPIKREGSQGQNKTYLIALKLAQFDFLRRTGSRTAPLLLLDDIFDKLDAERVEQIVRLVGEEGFGQIFITDTNRDHLNSILVRMDSDYKLFHVCRGEVSL